MTAMTTTTARGRAAESLATAALEDAGYRVVARNVRAGRGEIDVVAWDADILCFVEVRARKDARFGGPEASVDDKKRARLVSAARAYLADDPTPPRCRFDVVGVEGRAGAETVRIHRGAFEATA